MKVLYSKLYQIYLDATHWAISSPATVTAEIEKSGKIDLRKTMTSSALDDVGRSPTMRRQLSEVSL